MRLLHLSIASLATCALAPIATAQTLVGTSFAGDIPATSAPSAEIYGAVGIDFARGREALAAGDYSRAVRLLDPLADGSRDPSSRLLAGYAHLGNGTLTKAQRHFAAAAQLDRRAPAAELGLGLVAVAERDYAAARAVLARLESRAERCENECARIDQAAAALRRAIG